MRTSTCRNLGSSRKGRKADAGRAPLSRRIVGLAMAVVLALGMAPTLAFADTVETTAQTAGEDNLAVGAHLDAPANAAAAAAVADTAAPQAQVQAQQNLTTQVPDQGQSLQTQDGDAADTPKFHIQTAQIQGINGTTLSTGPNYKHVPTTYYFDLNKGDYPVPYSGNGIPLANGLANYMQASGIYFPGDKIVFLPVEDPEPGVNGYNGQPGVVIANDKGEWTDWQVNDKIGPLRVTGATTVGNWHTHTYITELTVEDGPVMFSTGSGNGGASGWADSDPDDWSHAQNWWSASTICFVELPKYHPIEYHYYCGD